jgi:hypothetical protein
MFGLRLEDSNKIGVTEIFCEDMNWVQQVKGSIKQWAFVNMALNFGIPCKLSFLRLWRISGHK